MAGRTNAATWVGWDAIPPIGVRRPPARPLTEPIKHQRQMWVKKHVAAADRFDLRLAVRGQRRVPISIMAERPQGTVSVLTFSSSPPLQANGRFVKTRVPSTVENLGFRKARIRHAG